MNATVNLNWETGELFRLHFGNIMEIAAEKVARGFRSQQVRLPLKSVLSLLHRGKENRDGCCLWNSRCTLLSSQERITVLMILVKACLVAEWAIQLGYNVHWPCGRRAADVRGSNPRPCSLLVPLTPRYTPHPFFPLHRACAICHH